MPREDFFDRPWNYTWTFDDYLLYYQGSVCMSCGATFADPSRTHTTGKEVPRSAEDPDVCESCYEAEQQFLSEFDDCEVAGE